MRAGLQDNLSRFAVAAPFWSDANEELIAATFSLVLATVEGEIQFVHVIWQGGGRRDLGHGAMKRSVPAFVVLDMTSSACI